MPMIITRGAASAQAYGWARRITSGGATIVSLDFANSLYVKSSVSYDLGTLPGWSYSRSTDANLTTTYVQQSPNIITYSSDLSNAAWSYLRATYTVGQTAPNGSATAFLVTDSAVTNNHALVYNSISTSSGATVTGSVYLKKNAGQYCQVNFNANVGGAGFYITVDLTNGTITESLATGAGSIAGSSISPVSGYAGWYRVSLTGSCTGATSYNFWAVTGTNAASGAGFAPSYLGAYSRYVFGPQVELSSIVNGYIPTTTPPPSAVVAFPATTTNLLQGSSVLSNTTYWSNTRLGSITGGQSDPTGGTSAFLLSQTTSTFDGQQIYQDGSIVQTSSTATQHTFSVYAKAGTYDYIKISFVDQNTSKYVIIVYQFSTKTVTDSVSSGGWTLNSTSAVYLSNGWVRVVFSVNTPSSTTVGARIGPSNQAGSYITGVSTNNIYVYGPQIEAGVIANIYVPTTSAAASAAIPRITNIGFYDEQQSTNIIFPSNDFSSWNQNNSSTITQGFTAPDGSTTASKFVVGTTSSNCTRYVFGTATAGFVSSFYVKQGTTNRVYMGFYDSVLFYTNSYFDFSTNTLVVPGSGGYSGGYQVLANGWYRIWISTPNASGGSQQILYLSPINSTGTGPNDTTAGDYHYFWGAQVELGSVPTSYTPTTSASATRGADVASITYTGGTTGVVTYGAAGSATSGATGSFNLGYSSGGAWINNYVKTLTTS